MNITEKAAFNKYEALGYDIITNGVPDLILLKDGKISFVEVKAKYNSLQINQFEAISLLRSNRFKVRFEGEGADRAKYQYGEWKRYPWSLKKAKRKREARR